MSKGIALGSMNSKLQRLADLNLPMVISEFDLRTGDIPDGPMGPYTGTPSLKTTPRAQAAVMTLLVANWFAQPSLEGYGGGGYVGGCGGCGGGG